MIAFRYSRWLACGLCWIVGLVCSPAQDVDVPVDIAGNDDVKRIMQSFEGRGVMRDDSAPSTPDEAIRQFKVAEGLEVELVAAEPDLAQPLFLSWDSRGRMWVAEYRQYQFPAGLKIIRYDEHLRAVFDRVPPPPPKGPRGADRISVFEDTDDDGLVDAGKTVIEGLNIATSMAIDDAGIWVLNPPYLLYYPDRDHDDVPDSDPEVHLSGFGLQDTHAVANSLTIAPDGWLYGANGSTTVGNVSSDVTKGVRFDGQCIWRYHPRSKVFEIYAEGGGNTFSLEFDTGGRVFSGTNGGNTRGWYYPQGSYSHKNWGKHGPLTNPYALGFFSAMNMEGDPRRFAQAFCLYEGGLLPARFQRSVIAANSLHNLVWHSQLLPDGSTYRTIDQPNLLESPDRWFRPVYTGVGPDGAVYLADWYDTRLSHVSPLDDWHKTSGRVYRVKPVGTQPKYELGDMRLLSSAELLECFSSTNKWVRQRASMQLSWRQDASLQPELVRRIVDDHSLESLWCLDQLGLLTDEHVSDFLDSPSADIRRWVVRLLGDQHRDHDGLIELARSEQEIQVRSQLASTAKRLSSRCGLVIIKNLISHHDDLSDPHLPLLLWWAIEAHAPSFDEIRSLLQDSTVWESSVAHEVLLSRLMQRYAVQASTDDLQRCQVLLQLAPNESARQKLLEGMNLAFQGRDLPKLPDQLQAAFARYRQNVSGSDLILKILQGDEQGIADAVAVLRKPNQNLPMAIEIALSFGQSPHHSAESALLDLATGRRASSAALQRVALVALRKYESPEIAQGILQQMASRISAEHGLRETAFRTLATRPAWAEALLAELKTQWRVRREDVPGDVVQQLRFYQQPAIADEVRVLFGSPQTVATDAQIQEMKRLGSLIASRPGDVQAGAIHFAKKCATCHRLFGDGATIGPELDGYQRGKIDFWLNAIMLPNLEIREGYQSYLALTVDGRAITGIITEQTTSSVTLRSSQEDSVTLPREQIEILKAVPTSLMPTGLLDEMTDQQICDLFAYLSQGV